MCLMLRSFCVIKLLWHSGIVLCEGDHVLFDGDFVLFYSCLGHLLETHVLCRLLLYVIVGGCWGLELLQVERFVVMHH